MSLKKARKTNSKQPMAASTNLLIESLSENESDNVPDLELLPPSSSLNAAGDHTANSSGGSGRVKRKRFTKLRKNRINPSDSEENIEISGGGQNVQLPCCWVWSLSLLLFSLVVGLATLTWFTLGLCHELNRLKAQRTGYEPANLAKAIRAELKPALASFRTELTDSCCASPAAATVSLSVTPANSAQQPDSKQGDFESIYSHLEILKQQLQSIKDEMEMRTNERTTIAASLLPSSAPSADQLALVQQLRTDVAALRDGGQTLQRRLTDMNNTLTRLDQCACRGADLTATSPLQTTAVQQKGKSETAVSSNGAVAKTLPSSPLPPVLTSSTDTSQTTAAPSTTQPVTTVATSSSDSAAAHALFPTRSKP